MPDWKQIVREHLAVLRLPPEREIEIVEELALHLETAYEDALADGLSAAEAEACAVQSYDWRLLECELIRAERPVAVRALQPSLELIERKGGIRMETLWQDLRFGARMLAKNPGFTLIAVLTLSLGIGANTAIFSIVNAVLLRPFPYQAPERLVILQERVSVGGGFSPSYLNFVDWRAQNTSFDSMVAARSLESFNFTGAGEPERLRGRLVSAEFFSTLGIKPLLGRDFLAEEDRPSATPAAILSYGFWRRRFGEDPSVIGKQLTLNSQSFTVVGITPANFQFGA